MHEAQAKRLFGFIAMGGTLGAIAGAGLTETLSRGQAFGWRLPLALGPGGLMVASAVFLELAAQCALALARRFHLGTTAGAPAEPGPGAWEGLRLVARSRYLQLMGGYMLLYTITSTFLYLAQGTIVAQAFASRAARTAAFARLDLWTNLLTLAGQVLLTGRVLQRFRMAGILLVLPVLTLLGFGGLWALPTFGMLALVQVSRRGLHYALDRPAREILYIPLGPEEKYKSKPFLDTFVYRTGDLLGVWAPTVLALVAIPAGAAAMAASAAWFGTAAALGRWNRRVTGV
jgi:AAA family ATP:ADP antiporter